jgi:hypothetical protein
MGFCEKPIEITKNTMDHVPFSESAKIGNNSTVVKTVKMALQKHFQSQTYREHLNKRYYNE